MVLQIAVCCLLVLGFGWLLWRLEGALRTPVHPGAHTALTVVVTARGDAPELEHTLRGLLWLRESGALRAQLLVLDAGMTPQASELVRRMSLGNSGIRLCGSEDICQWMQTQARKKSD